MINSPYQTIYLSLKPSKLILIAQIMIFGAASFIIYRLDIPPLLQSALLAVTTAIFTLEARKNALLQNRRSIIGIALANNRISVTTRRGTNKTVRLLPCSLVSPRLTALVVKGQGKLIPTTVYLTTDNCDQVAYRRLRVYLNLRGKKLLAHPRSI